MDNTKEIIIYNKLVNFNYFVKENFNAGLSLYGWQAKCIRLRRLNINYSRLIFTNNVVRLIGCQFSLPHFISSKNIDKTSCIKVLLKKKEISKIKSIIRNIGYTVIPSNIFFEKGLFKIKICIAIGKKKYDKRLSLKLKDLKMKKIRALHNY